MERKPGFSIHACNQIVEVSLVRQNHQGKEREMVLDLGREG